MGLIVLAKTGAIASSVYGETGLLKIWAVGSRKFIALLVRQAPAGNDSQNPMGSQRFAEGVAAQRHARTWGHKTVMEPRRGASNRE